MIQMRKRLSKVFNYQCGVFAISAVMASVPSCTKDPFENVSGGCTVSINLNGGIAGTKATDPLHDTLGVSGGIKELLIYLFDSNTDNIVNFRRITDPDSLVNIKIKTTIGSKKIYILANPHIGDGFGGIFNEYNYYNLQTSLLEEEPGFFTMSGKNMDFYASENSVVDISLERFVSKVVLNSLKTDFAGGPFNGMLLTDVKVYLINVVSKKLIHNGAETSPCTVINLGANAPAGYSGALIENMIYDSIPQDIGDIIYTTKHHFYAYSNTTATENSYIKYTKLVIEATLNETKYYYPIPVNKTGFGTSNNGGILRNTVYLMDVIIKNAGSPTPGSFPPSTSYQTNLSVLPFNSFTLGSIEI